MQAHDLEAGRALEPLAQAEHARGDHEVDRAPARHRLDVVERAEPLAVAREVEPGLLERLPHGRRVVGRVARLRASAREADLAGPGIALVLGAADEEQLEAARSASRKTRATAARIPRRPPANACPSPAQIGPPDHGRLASASKARAWVSQRKAMLGARPPASSSASTSPGAA